MNLNWILSRWNEGLLATTYGILYPGVHALSVLSVCLVSFIVIKSTRSLPLGTLAGLSVVAIHEGVWAVLGILYFGSQVVVGDHYIFPYVGLLVLSVVFLRKFGRTMTLMFAFSVGYYLAGAGVGAVWAGAFSEWSAVLGWALPTLPWYFLARKEYPFGRREIIVLALALAVVLLSFPLVRTVYCGATFDGSTTWIVSRC